MTGGAAAHDLTTETADAPPPGWDDLWARTPDAEFTQTSLWAELAARHFPAAFARWHTVRTDGDLLGGVVLLGRARRGLVRLEGQVEGTIGGPLVRGDLEPARRDAVLGRLLDSITDALGGRTGLVALTSAGHDRDRVAAVASPRTWRRDDFESAIVGCRGGLDHVGGELWTNNRRNERNRGLKRGATLHSGADVQALIEWYPLYEAKAAQWSQAPVPRSFLAALLEASPGATCFDHVRLDGAVVAGHVGFVSRGRLVAWQGAVRPDLVRTHFPTTLLYWRNVMTACEHGLEAVDFGGCVGRDSLWDFKRRCGAVAEPRTQLLARSWYGRAHRRLAGLARGSAGAGA